VTVHPVGDYYRDDLEVFEQDLEFDGFPRGAVNFAALHGF
jgi:hypothetical protein